MSTFKFAAVVATKTHKAGGSLTTPDTNNKLPIQFSPVAGVAPNRALVLSGTVAESLGFEAGNTYFVQATFKENNEYGDNYTILNRGKLSTIEALDVEDRLGQPRVIQTENGKNVSVKAEVEETITSENGID